MMFKPPGLKELESLVKTCHKHPTGARLAAVLVVSFTLSCGVLAFITRGAG